MSYRELDAYTQSVYETPRIFEPMGHTSLTCGPTSTRTSLPTADAQQVLIFNPSATEDANIRMGDNTVEADASCTTIPARTQVGLSKPFIDDVVTGKRRLATDISGYCGVGPLVLQISDGRGL